MFLNVATATPSGHFLVSRKKPSIIVQTHLISVSLRNKRKSWNKAGINQKRFRAINKENGTAVWFAMQTAMPFSSSGKKETEKQVFTLFELLFHLLVSICVGDDRRDGVRHDGGAAVPVGGGDDGDDPTSPNPSSSRHKRAHRSGGLHKRRYPVRP